jgi:hypothetical protein
MKVFVLSFNDPHMPDETMLDFLDSRRDVLNWMSMSFLPNTVFILSDATVEKLTNSIRRRFPNSFFLISEFNTRKANGALPDEAWNFLNKSSG